MRAVGVEEAAPVGAEQLDRFLACDGAERDRLPRPLERRRIDRTAERRSEEHTSELQSLMRNSYAVFCSNKKNTNCIPYNSNKDRILHKPRSPTTTQHKRHTRHD